MESSLSNISVSRGAMAQGPAETAGNVAVTGTVTGMVESVFLKKFREKFLGTGGPRPWPRAAVNTNAEFTTEFTDVFRSMFQRLEASIAAPQSNVDGSAKQMIQQLLEETGWPNPAKAPVPEPWKSDGHEGVFRRYEIACAMNILMQAYHNDQPIGGGISSFPPDR
jgi:hypothetical protein